MALGSDNAPIYERFLDAVFPDGMAVVNTSVRNQAGVAATLPARIAMQPLLQAVLDTELDGTELGVYFEQTLDRLLPRARLTMSASTSTGTETTRPSGWTMPIQVS